VSAYRDRLIARVVAYVREHSGCSGLDIQRAAGTIEWRTFYKGWHAYEHNVEGKPLHGCVYRMRDDGSRRFGFFVVEPVALTAPTPVPGRPPATALTLAERVGFEPRRPSPGLSLEPFWAPRRIQLSSPPPRRRVADLGVWAALRDRSVTDARRFGCWRRLMRSIST
jgi:hypothetical protein